MPVKLDWKRINPVADLKYHEPRSSGSGHDGCTVRVECRDPDTGNYEPLLFQGPKMRIPFGLDAKETKDGVKYYCPLSFPSVKKQNGEYTVDPDCEDALGFLKFLQQIDSSNKAAASMLCMSWFKKEMSADVLNELYYHNMSIPKDEEKYSPTFSTKLRHKGSEFQTEFWNQKRERIEFDAISKGLTVIPLIQARSIWFAGKNFGMSFQVVQLMVFERDNFQGCAIDFGEVEKPLSIALDEEDEAEAQKSKGSKRPRRG
jgi:hypothetical protein